MDSPDPNVPDLATVLRTLSAYTPAPSSTPNPATQNPSAAYPAHHGSQPARPVPSTTEHLVRDQDQNRGPTPASSTTNKANLPDPSGIIAWPAALRCVMRTVAQNEALQAKIRRLIEMQHEHERKWWEAREALLTKQKARAERKKKLDEVLRSVGGSVATGSEVTSPEEDLAELENYDKKVYKALCDMSRALDTELRGLGIPFFAVKHHLVLPPSNPSAGNDSNTSGAVETGQKAISTEELIAFQRRMLGLLEDLCKEA